MEEIAVENKSYTSKLRALLSIRNYNKELTEHFKQMQQIEKSLNDVQSDALAILKIHSTEEIQTKWQDVVREQNAALYDIHVLLKNTKQNIQNKKRSSSRAMWKQFELQIAKLKTTFREAENFGFDHLPQKEIIHWKMDICSIEDSIVTLLISHARSCVVEMELIELYTPRELDYITKIVMDKIPENFMFEEAEKYEHEYLAALEEYKKEFKKDKNVWDKVLDVIAGGAHQSPSQRVMMSRWLNGEKGDLD